MTSRRERTTQRGSHWCDICDRPIDHHCPHSGLGSRARRRAAERAARKERKS